MKAPRSHPNTAFCTARAHADPVLCAKEQPLHLRDFGRYQASDRSVSQAAISVLWYCGRCDSTRPEARGRDLEGAKITLNEYVDRWLNTAVKPGVRQKTCQDYEGILRRYIRPGLGDSVLVSMRTVDIQANYQRMIERGLSPPTVRYTHAVFPVHTRGIKVGAAAGFAMAPVARESCRWCQNPAATQRRNAFTHCRAGASFSQGCSGDSSWPQ